MIFVDEEPKRCSACGALICAGSKYFTYKGSICCCDEDCMKDVLFEEHSCDFEEGYVQSAEDRELEYGDIKFHENNF